MQNITMALLNDTHKPCLKKAGVFHNPPLPFMIVMTIVGNLHRNYIPEHLSNTFIHGKTCLPDVEKS